MQIAESASCIDYSDGLILPETLTFVGSDTETRMTVTVPTEDDLVGDGPGRITATIPAGEGYSFTTVGRSATVAVVETEPELTVGDVTVDEDAGAATVAVGLSHAYDHTVRFDWRTAEPPTGRRLPRTGYFTASSGSRSNRLQPGT